MDKENLLSNIIPEICYMLPHTLQLHFAIIFVRCITVSCNDNAAAFRTLARSLL